MKLAYQTFPISAHDLENLLSIWQNKQNSESKTGQKGYEFSNQKGPQQLQNVLCEEKVNLVVRLYHYLCVVIEIYAS